jgi:hypothetical protein
MIPLAKRVGFMKRAGMKSFELMRDLCRQHGAKNVAGLLGYSLTTIHKWSRPGGAAGSGVTNLLDRLAALIGATADQTIVRWLCRCAGGFFVANPKTALLPPVSPSAVKQQVVRQLAELQVKVALLTDQPATQAEAESFRYEWERLKSDLEGLATKREAECFAEPETAARNREMVNGETKFGTGRPKRLGTNGTWLTSMFLAFQAWWPEGDWLMVFCG